MIPPPPRLDLRARAETEELMDAADLDTASYAALLRDLARVNIVTLAARPTLGFLSRGIGQRQRFRLLDVGFGDGDMLRRVARWAAVRGLSADLVGIDLNPHSAPVAAIDTPPELPIEHRTGDYASLAREHWDFIVSSLVAHHMTHTQLIAFLRFMEAHAAAGWFINDLRRSAFAHRAFPLLARLARWHPIVQHDGTLSIARSYRAKEWPPILAEAGIAAARVFPAFPFRLCVERLR